MFNFFQPNNFRFFLLRFTMVWRLIQELNTRQNDKTVLKPKISKAVKMIEISINKVKRLHTETNDEAYIKIK